MGGHPSGEAPVKRRGTNSHASKAKQAAKDRRRLEEAKVRYQVARCYVEHLSDRDLSYREAEAHVKQLMSDGELAGDPDDAPDHVSIWRWAKEYEAIQEQGRSPGVVDFIAESSGGRNRKKLDPELKDWLEDQTMGSTISSVPMLHRAAVRAAEENGWEEPTRWQIRRFVEEFPIDDLSAARHGRRAGLIDGVPAGTLPTDRTHQIWMLDETQAPVWVRTLDPRTASWRPVKPWIILCIDVHSRAIISWWAVDPFKYGVDGAYRSREVLGTLLAAALPELAHSSTEDFAGYLPEEIRWDNHGTHAALTTELEDCGIEVPRAVSRMPNRHGRIEKLHGTVKALCETMVGADHVHRPVHEAAMSEHPKKTRGRIAGTTDRVHKTSPIHVEDLHKIGAFREAFGERVEDYNSTTHSFLNGMSPELAYHQGLEPAETRTGWDALLLMENKVLTCSKAGVEHVEAGYRVRFAAESAGIELKRGENVKVFCDPLQRRLFVDREQGFLALKPVEEWAQEVDVEGRIRRNRRRASEASDYADEVRREQLDREAGAGASERAKAALAEEIDDDGWEDGVPPRHQGLVAHQRAKAKKNLRDRAAAGPADVPEVGEDGRTRRRRGMASDPMDEVRLKEEVS